MKFGPQLGVFTTLFSSNTGCVARRVQGRVNSGALYAGLRDNSGFADRMGAVQTPPATGHLGQIHCA